MDRLRLAPKREDRVVPVLERVGQVGWLRLAVIGLTFFYVAFNWGWGWDPRQDLLIVTANPKNFGSGPLAAPERRLIVLEPAAHWADGTGSGIPMANWVDGEPAPGHPHPFPN